MLCQSFLHFIVILIAVVNWFVVFILVYVLGMKYTLLKIKVVEITTVSRHIYLHRLLNLSHKNKSRSTFCDHIYDYYANIKIDNKKSIGDWRVLQIFDVKTTWQWHPFFLVFLWINKYVIYIYFDKINDCVDILSFYIK